MRIDIATAKKLVQNYKQNHWTIINNSCASLQTNPSFPNVQDSRSVWFSMADLKMFMNDAGSRGADGVRFYFGEYSADIIANMGSSTIPNSTQLYTGLHTLVMIPTKQDVTGMSHDFNMACSNPSDFSNPADLAAENHGTLNPPPWPLAATAPQVINVGQDFMIFCDQNP